MKTCKDCKEKSEKLTRKGICHQCYMRERNAKYQGKKYIPIKDLSETEREKILNMRAKRAEKKTTTTTNNIVETDTENDSQQALVNKIAKGDMKLYQEILKLLNINEEEIRAEVDRDIDNEFSRRKISLIVDNCELDKAFDMVYNSLCEENFLTDYVAAENALTDFVNDFQHQNENATLEDLRSFIVTAIRENQSLIRRRPYKNMCIQLECTERIRKYAKEHPDFMEILNDTRISLIDEIKKQQNPVYASKDSGIILNQGNVLPEKKGVKQRYDVWVPCYGLYGNKNQEIFRLHGGTLADSPEKAKDNLRKTIARLSNVTYKDIDIKVGLWNELHPAKEGA